jgi:hypothetical protein
MKNCLFFVFLTFSLYTKAQVDTLSPAIKISAYIETYYIYDFGNPANHQLPDFIYSFNRHNEINLNLGLIKAAYETSMVRANLAIMTGTYANANLAGEPGVLRNVFEANSGIKISKNNNLWVDVGIFPSHIGFESAIGAETWNLTRSILADNSPYYESGAKITYICANEKWLLSGLILNGWQRIQRIPGNQTPAFGHQLTFTPNKKIKLNSSSFIGNDYPEPQRRMRYFHNFYGIFQIRERLGLTLGFDIGTEQQERGSFEYNLWYSPVIIIRSAVTEKLFVSARAEYYSDPSEVIVSTITANGFRTFGFSLNIDYKITENVMWRLEGRTFNSRDRMFFIDGLPAQNTGLVGTSIAFSF